MGYEISKGVAENELSEWLREAAKKFGTFKDGRVNYTHAPNAPTIACVVTYKDQILLLKRGEELADAEGYWSVIHGFIDKNRPVSEIAAEEIEEELGLNVSANQIKVGDSYTINNPNNKRTYTIFPCLINLKLKPEIKLDDEHTDYAWISRAELGSYHILEDLPRTVDEALKLL